MRLRGGPYSITAGQTTLITPPTVGPQLNGYNWVAIYNSTPNILNVTDQFGTDVLYPNIANLYQSGANNVPSAISVSPVTTDSAGTAEGTVTATFYDLSEPQPQGFPLPLPSNTTSAPFRGVSAVPVLSPLTAQAGGSYTLNCTVRGVGSAAILGIADQSGNAAASTLSVPSGATATAIQQGTYAALFIISGLPVGTFAVTVTCTANTLQGAILCILDGLSSSPVQASNINQATNANPNSTAITPGADGNLLVYVVGISASVALQMTAANTGSRSREIMAAIPLESSAAGSPISAIVSVMSAAGGTPYSFQWTLSASESYSVIAAVLQ